MATYKLNDNKNSLLIKIDKKNKLDKICVTCGKLCNMFCDNYCGSWLCPNKHYSYFDKEGNSHKGHSPYCGYESDEIENRDEDIRNLIKNLKVNGHTCIKEYGTNPIKFKWCKKSKCSNSISCFFFG